MYIYICTRVTTLIPYMLHTIDYEFYISANHKNNCALHIHVIITLVDINHKHSTSKTRWKPERKFVLYMYMCIVAQEEQNFR